MEKLNHCPVCKGTTLVPLGEFKDHMVSKELFELSKCGACSHVFTNPRIEESNIGPYYDSPDYISHTDDNRGLFAQLYQRLREVNLKRKRSLVKKFAQGGSLLDIGCGTGQFLHFMLDSGFSAAGVEVNEGARKKASSRASVASSISEIEGDFETITMWHVLEHVYDLDALFAFFNSNLKGHAIIAVPNHESHDALHYGSNWAAWDVPIHVHHFNKNSLAVLAENHGFEIAHIEPMKLDSYYISLLSEQFKAGRNQRTVGDWIRGFVQGALSNAKAGSNNTSSLIYVLRKKV
jgi:2-polyprenyl-3-methyl-5-hydroxy-6-metoxy-1,4-benzoquinol methylase